MPSLRSASPAVAALLAGALALSSCSSSPSTPDYGLPAVPGGCGKTTTMQAPETIPLSIQKSGAGKIAEAAVCIDGKGPYPFAVSTGTGSTVVVPSLVRSLGLPGGGSPQALRGVTCTASTKQTAFRVWSIAGMPLASQDVAVASLPSMGLDHPPMGLLGADVLTRFGALRLDYTAKRLVLATGEEAAPARTTFILGQASTGPPAGLVKSVHPAGAPLSVLESQAGTVATTQVAFGKARGTFTVDTGSLSSSLAPSLQSSLQLASAGASAPVSGPGCSGTAQQVKSGAWALGTVTLPAASLVSHGFTGTVNQQILGALGSDVLSSYGSIVLDYHGAHLWLGAG